MTDLSAFDIIDLIGRPFAYGGRGPDVYDCYGLLMELYRRTGRTLPDMRSDREIERISQSMSEEVRAAWRQVEPRPGVAILFRIKGYGAHVGFSLPNDKFAHTWEGVGGVCIERMSDWERRIIAHYDYAGHH